MPRTKSTQSTFGLIPMSSQTEGLNDSPRSPRRNEPLPASQESLDYDDANHDSVVPAAKKHKLSKTSTHALNDTAVKMVEVFTDQDDRVDMEVDRHAQTLVVVDLLQRVLNEIKVIREEVDSINAKLPTVLPLLKVINVVEDGGKTNIDAMVKKAWWSPNCPGYSHHCRAIEELVFRMMEKKPEVLGTNGAQLMDSDNAAGQDVVLACIRTSVDNMRFSWKQKIYEAAGGSNDGEVENHKKFVEAIIENSPTLQLSWGVIYRAALLRALATKISAKDTSGRWNRDFWSAMDPSVAQVVANASGTIEEEGEAKK
ncbi:hypothetical protein CF326_g5695 [Tilletia indica]|nr:hypothetical protein CF326_g5695 [Tilletia indica]